MHQTAKKLTETRGCARFPIQRIVVYATAAPRTPINAAPTALRRCAGVTCSSPVAIALVVLAMGIPSLAPLATGVEELSPENREIGRAIRTTPASEKMPAICSLREKGS